MQKEILKVTNSEVHVQIHNYYTEKDFKTLITFPVSNGDFGNLEFNERSFAKDSHVFRKRLTVPLVHCNSSCTV